MDKIAADVIGIEAGKLANRYGIADIQRVIGIMKKAASLFPSRKVLHSSLISRQSFKNFTIG